MAEVFSERESNHPTDCAIEILPGAKLPKSKIYSMTPREMEELQSFID